jgi:hypothetical protein
VEVDEFVAQENHFVSIIEVNSEIITYWCVLDQKFLQPYYWVIFHSGCLNHKYWVALTNYKTIACEANVTSWHLPIKLTDILKFGGSSSKLVLTVYQSNGWWKNKFHLWKFALLSWQRGWKNDVHMAIRDCNEARSINPMSTWAHHNMAEALSQVCTSYLQSFKSLLCRCSYFPKFAI